MDLTGDDALVPLDSMRRPTPQHTRARLAPALADDTVGSDPDTGEAVAANQSPTPPSNEPAPASGRMGSQAAIYALGIVLQRALSFVMVPLYTHVLTPAEYGTIQLIGTVLDLVAMFAGMKLSGGVFMLYHAEDTPSGKARVLSTSFLLIASGFGVAAVSMGLFAPWISQLLFSKSDHGYVLILWVAAGSFATQGLVIVPALSFRVFNEAKLFVAREAGQLLLQALLNILFLVVLRYGVISLFLSTFIAQGLFGLAITTRMLRRTGSVFSRRIAIDLWRFGLPLIVTQGAVFIMTLGGRFLLEKEAGLAVLGIYSLAQTAGMLVVQFGNTPFMLVWESERFNPATLRDDSMHARAFVYLNVLLITAGVGLGVFASDFVHIMASRAYASTAAVIPIFLLAYVFQCWAMALDTGILLTGRTGPVAVANWVAAAVAMAGFFLLVKPWGAEGAALATTAAFATRFAMIYWTSQRLHHINYRWTPVLQLVGLGTLAVTSATFVRVSGPVVSILVHGVFLCGFVGATWFSGVLQPSERERIIAELRRRSLRLKTAMAVS